MRKLISLLSLVIIGSSVMTPVGFAEEDEDEQLSNTLYEMHEEERAEDREMQRQEEAEEEDRQDAIERDVEDNLERIDDGVGMDEDVVEIDSDLDELEKSEMDYESEVLDNEILENSPEVAAAEAALPDARFEADVARAKQAVAEAEQGFAEGKVNEALKALDEANDADGKEKAKEAFDKAYDELEAANAVADAAKAATDKAEAKVEDLENARNRALDAYYQNKKSILPQTIKGIDKCKVLMNEVAMNSLAAKKKFEDREDEYIQDVLGCGIKTGDMRLWMIPYYIRFILEFLLQIAGLVAVGGIVFGGYLYMFAGVSDEKDRGKKAIMYGVAGIIVAMVAWGFVNILISFLTG